MEIKPVEVTWTRAFKVWWYVAWRSTMATMGAGVILGFIEMALIVFLKLKLTSTMRIMVLNYRVLATMVIWLLFCIFVTKQAFKKQFSDFKIMMAEK